MLYVDIFLKGAGMGERKIYVSVGMAYLLLLKELRRKKKKKMFLREQELFEETTVSMKDIYKKKKKTHTQHKMIHDKEFLVCSMNSLYFQAPSKGCMKAKDW